jgi:UDP-N-acetylenolpyruvoylglucosamine reductase
MVMPSTEREVGVRRDDSGLVRGRVTPNAPLAPLVWFKSGGMAETLFEPIDATDLQTFIRGVDPAAPVWPLGLGSNLIVRDAGVRGVTVRLGKPFAVVVHRASSCRVRRAMRGSLGLNFCAEFLVLSAASSE